MKQKVDLCLPVAGEVGDGEGLLVGMGFFFGGVGNVMKLNILKATEFYTLKGGILWNVNYFLMKHF